MEAARAAILDRLAKRDRLALRTHEPALAGGGPRRFEDPACLADAAGEALYARLDPAHELSPPARAFARSPDHPCTGRFQMVVEPCLTDPHVWYLAADPAMQDGLEFAYLEDQPAPKSSRACSSACPPASGPSWWLWDSGGRVAVFSSVRTTIGVRSGCARRCAAPRDPLRGGGQPVRHPPLLRSP